MNNLVSYLFTQLFFFSPIEEMKRMMKKLDHWNSQISSNDKLVRELQERERDMVAAMDAKDSQLAILKVRLQEADQELRVMQNKADELSAENERYCYNYMSCYVVQWYLRKANSHGTKGFVRYSEVSAIGEE